MLLKDQSFEVFEGQPLLMVSLTLCPSGLSFWMSVADSTRRLAGSIHHIHDCSPMSKQEDSLSVVEEEGAPYSGLCPNFYFNDGNCNGLLFGVDAGVLFNVDSPFPARIVCVAHYMTETMHLLICGDTKGNIIQWTLDTSVCSLAHKSRALSYRMQVNRTFDCRLARVFKSIHGKEKIGMIFCHPEAFTVYSASKNHSIRQFCIEDSELREAGEIRLKDIGSAEVSRQRSIFSIQNMGVR